MEIRNGTPFMVAQAVVLDKSAAEQLIVALKCTYTISDRGELRPAEEQDPVRPAEEFHGDPVATSIKHEAEMGPPKLATDAFLVGSARATRAGTRSVEVRFRVGDREKIAVVVGNRHWVHGVSGASASEPEPFESIPLTWENAFGGQDLTPENPAHHANEPRNPVGRGFRAKNSRAPWEGELLPNIENPAEYFQSFGQRVAPTGFGPIGRNWNPRVTFAGTYDQKWLEERVPLLPLDFDDRFHSAAPADLIMPGYLEGGAWVDVVGCTANGRVFFQLPQFAPAARVLVSGQEHDVAMSCNTVTVDTDRMRLIMLWKGMHRVHRELPRLRCTTISAKGATA